MELRHDGAVYKVSPWALSWNDGNYYLIAYDGEKGIIKHFRVDKMLHIELNGEKREGKQVFQSFDMAAYARKMFGIVWWKRRKRCVWSVKTRSGVIIRTGLEKNVTLNRLDDTHFFVNVEAAVSRQFLSWVIGLGEGVKITGPESVVARMEDEICRLMRHIRSK